MARKKGPATLVNEAIDTGALVPPDLVPIIEPDPAPFYQGPRPGRYPKNPLVILSQKVALNKENLLNAAYDMIISSVASSVPMLCQLECPHQVSCLLAEEDRPRSMPSGGHPESGMRCPTEHYLFYTMFYAYLAQLGIEEASPIEVQTAATLAGIQVKKRRIEDLISQQGMIVEQAIGTDRVTGMTQVQHVEHPLLNSLERLEKREDAIKKQFYITREQIEAKKRAAQEGHMKTTAQWLSMADDDIINVELAE